MIYHPYFFALVARQRHSELVAEADEVRRSKQLRMPRERLRTQPRSGRT
jgi:hypothetical protein